MKYPTKRNIFAFMIIGFLGKGGSGKSTLSHRFIQHLTDQNLDVLGIDADHNMDLSARLGVSDHEVYFGTSTDELKKKAQCDSYADIVLKQKLSFRLDPPDEYTSRYAKPIGVNTRIMTAGPHHEEVLYGQTCSHSLVTPLKIYLPLLQLEKNQAVVVDCTAGTDSSGTGIGTAFDLAIIIVEPTPWGIKAAKQIAHINSFYGTPFEFVLNKVHSIGISDEIFSALEKKPLGIIRANPLLDNPAHTMDEETRSVMKAIQTCAEAQPKKALERTQRKFMLNQEYETARH